MSTLVEPVTLAPGPQTTSRVNKLMSVTLQIEDSQTGRRGLESGSHTHAAPEIPLHLTHHTPDKLANSLSLDSLINAWKSTQILMYCTYTKSFQIIARTQDLAEARFPKPKFC